MFFTMCTPNAQAGQVQPWSISIIEVYVQRGPYSSQMTSAMRNWVKTLNGKLLVNILSSKTALKMSHIEFVFDQNLQEGVIESGHKKANRPYVRININTANIEKDVLQAKFSHYAGIALGLDESQNQNSVLFKTPAKNQKMLDEDIISLKKLYGVKIKKKSIR